MCSVNKTAIFSEIFNQYSYNLYKSLADLIVANTIGEKIQKLRYSLNLSQLQFAKSIHRGFGTVTKWEQGITVPSEEAIRDIIKIYNLDDEYFNL